MRHNGFSETRDPILKPLDTIECRDAILTPDEDRSLTVTARLLKRKGPARRPALG